MLLFLMLAMFSIIATIPSYGQWNADPTVNNLIASVGDKGTGVVNNPIAASDGDGGMFFAWVDNRNTAVSGDDLFIIRITKNGTVAPGFAAGGNIVCNAIGNQTNPAMVADGNGGVNIVWQDPRDNATKSSDIYGIKVKADGSLEGSANGFLIAGTNFGENSPVIATVAPQKVAVVWRFTGTTSGVDLAMNIADFNTKTLDFTNATLLSDKANAQTNQQVIADGSGGAIVVWTDARVATTNIHLYGQRVNSAGTLLWGPVGNKEEGLQLTNTTGNILLPQMVADGSGGAVVAFGSTRVASDNANIYAIAVDAAGNNFWTANGVDVCLAISTQSNVRVVKSGSNFLVAWADRRESSNAQLSNNVDIFMQSLAPATGNPNWQIDGIAVIKQPNNQPNSQTEGFELLPDNTGGGYVVWDDGRVSTSDLDIYAQYVMSTGSLSWPEIGAPVATKSGSNQNWPKAVLGNQNNLIIAWRDSRTNTSAEIYASSLFQGGLLPVTLLELGAILEGKTVKVQWTTTQEQYLSHFEVENSRDGSQFEKFAHVKAQNRTGNHTYHALDATPAAGNNFYRIKSVNKDGSFAFSKIVKVNVVYQSLDQVHMYPNPVASSWNLQLNELPTGNYLVNIIDLSGRNIESHKVQKGNSNQTFVMSAGKLSSGLYRVQIVGENGKVYGVKSLVKR